MSIAGVTKRQEHQFQLVDAMPADLRSCVHEFGFAIVNVCLQAGVRKPSMIRQLVHEIWDGARQPSQRANGINNNSAIAKLDWLLLQEQCPVSANKLLRSLAQSNHFLVPRDPTTPMIAASMKAIETMGRLTKQDKHRIRLSAAIKANAQSMWQL